MNVFGDNNDSMFQCGERVHDDKSALTFNYRLRSPQALVVADDPEPGLGMNHKLLTLNC